MAFYDDEEVVGEYTTDFGNGRTLTIKLKPNFDSAEYVRQFMARSRAATNVEEKIKTLETKQLTAPTAEYDKIAKEIEELQKRADQIAVMSDVIFMTGNGWDRFASKEAEINNTPVAFTKEAIAGLKLKVLNKIVESLTKAMGMSDDSDPKAPLNESALPSSTTTAIQ